MEPILFAFMVFFRFLAVIFFVFAMVNSAHMAATLRAPGENKRGVEMIPLYYIGLCALCEMFARVI